MKVYKGLGSSPRSDYGTAHGHPNMETHDLQHFNEGGPEGLLLDNRHGMALGIMGVEEALRDAISWEVNLNLTEVAAEVCGWPMGQPAVIR
jgi:hypothetical protein